MKLEAVGDLALHLILSKLSPDEVSAVACVSRKLRSSASEDSLWSDFCFRDIELSEPLDPLGNPLSSFKATYKIWREAFGMYPWPLVKRVTRLWRRLKSYLRINFPEAEATLRNGASEADLQELESRLGVKLPLPTRIIYRFHDGQELVSHSSFGLIGGYCFDTHIVNVHLLPLNMVISKMEGIMKHLGFSKRSEYIVLAASTYFNKLFILNCSTGHLHVGTRNLPHQLEMMPCVPISRINSVHDCKSDNQQDGLLLWLEEHMRRLENGIIKVCERLNTRSINLFPQEPPLCSIAMANGVQVRASAVFVPELTDLQGVSHKYFFSHSIRMSLPISLQPEERIINGNSFSYCQLLTRHWIVREKETVISDFHRETVITMLPLLLPGSKEFAYQSTGKFRSSSGSMEGDFTFVPGSLANPEGNPSEATVARFPLQVPDYIF